MGTSITKNGNSISLRDQRLSCDDPSTRSTPTANTKADVKAEPKAGGEYAVQPGDTLWGISERVLGTKDPQRVQAYVDRTATENKLEDKNRLVPGQNLRLPAGTGKPSAETSEGAKKRATQGDVRSQLLAAKLQSGPTFERTQGGKLKVTGTDAGEDFDVRQDGERVDVRYRRYAADDPKKAEQDLTMSFDGVKGFELDTGKGNDVVRSTASGLYKGEGTDRYEVDANDSVVDARGNDRAHIKLRGDGNVALDSRGADAVAFDGNDGGAVVGEGDSLVAQGDRNVYLSTGGADGVVAGDDNLVWTANGRDDRGVVVGKDNTVVADESDRGTKIMWPTEGEAKRIMWSTKDQPGLLSLPGPGAPKAPELDPSALADRLDEGRSALGKSAAGARSDTVQVQALKDAASLGDNLFGKQQKLQDVLTHRSNEEIAALRDTYQEVHGRSLEDAIKRSNPPGAYRDALLKMLDGGRNEGARAKADPMQVTRDAVVLHEAMDGLGTDNKRLTNILATRSPEQIAEIAAAYQEMFGESLRSAVEGDTTLRFEKLLLAQLDRAGV